MKKLILFAIISIAWVLAFIVGKYIYVSLELPSSGPVHTLFFVGLGVIIGVITNIIVITRSNQ